MARTFANEVVETSQTTSTGTYDLDGVRKDAYRTFPEAYSNGDSPYYIVRNSTDTKWEHNRGGTLTYGTPNRLSRNVVRSSNADAAVSWTSDDLPLTIYSTRDADVDEGVVTGWLGTAIHALLRAGATWWDYTAGLSTRWIEKLYIGGGTNIEKGRAHIAAAIFAPAGNHLWVDNGTASLTIDDTYKDKIIDFDVTSANRVPTLPALSGLPTGWRVGLRGYGSTTNSLTLTPNGTDAIDSLSGGATKSLLGELPVVWVEKDGARNKWVTSYATPGAVAATQAEQEAGSSTAAFVTPGRQQYHPSAAKAWVQVAVSGGVPAATVSYNVSSITDSATGDGIINFTTAFSSASYAWLGGGTMQASVRWINVWRNLDRSKTASAFPFYTTNNSAAIVDGDEWSLGFFGDQ